MRIQCPKCRAVYKVDNSKVPATGRFARCTVCRERFPINADNSDPLDGPRSSDHVPHRKTEPAPGWRESKYTLLFGEIRKYYARQDATAKYHISSFCFAHREIPSLDYIKNEVAILKKLLSDNQKQQKDAAADPSLFLRPALESENLRCRAMIQIFRDMVTIKKRMAHRNIMVTYNQIFVVLKDVELAHDGK
jgi:predicted Zn finger-like uncharacterized protein